MKYLLIYYTGTYNTRYLTAMLRDRLAAAGNTVDTFEIDPLRSDVLDLSRYDVIGLGYPIYGFNAPWPFLKFIRRQHFPAGIRTFIYKNSGETYHANDASSISVVRKLRHDGARIENEYHFIFPYNIHFRFDDRLVREMLEIDDLLADILVKELSDGIPNIKKYRFVHRVVTFFVKLQFIGGNVNSFFYSVDRGKCSSCGLCVKNCPTKNIVIGTDGVPHFRHHCLMCMRCSMFCPKDAVRIGLFEGWHVNGAYDFEKIRCMENEGRIITDETKGFFSCYIETYKAVTERHRELFGERACNIM